VRPLLQSKRQQLDVSIPSEPVGIHADPARMVQILANLLSNASRYSPPQKSIRLIVELDSPGIALRIRDEGDGISSEMLPTIFDLFAQADHSLDRKSGGLGIGLTVVRGLVERHGGTIEVRSEGLGRGSEFVVRLPVLSHASSTELGEESGKIGGGGSEVRQRPRRVLLVEDNADASETLQMLLAGWGHEVHAASDGPAALELAAAVQPDLVLLDVGLPGMSGYEVARKLRALPSGAELQLVAMTGYGQEEDRRRSREAGVDRHLVKPVLPDHLRELFGDGD
jgi:CheY-like chemotaxis protein